MIGCGKWSEIAGPSKSEGKRQKKKKGKKQQNGVYWIELKDTVLYPEGGGQPTDYGTVSVLNSDAECDEKTVSMNIVSVQRQSDGRVLHQSPQSVPVGTAVEVEVDWDRRWDQMQQHSAQHLISAVFRNELNAPTVSWWMAERGKPSQIEMAIDSDGDITAEDIRKCEHSINGLIASAQKMTVHVFHDEPAVTEFAAKHDGFKMKALAEGAGPLRVVEIEGTEYNLCGGTHLVNTAQLQMISIVTFDVISISNSKSDSKSESNSKSDRILRIQFVAGDRVRSSYQSMFDREREIGKLLSCGSDQFESNIGKLQSEIRSKMSTLRTMEKRLCELEGQRLRADIESMTGNIRCVHRHFDGGESWKMLQSMCSEIIGLFPIDKVQFTLFLVLSVGTSPQQKGGRFMMTTNDKQKLEDNKKTIKQMVGGGGGRPGTFQGSTQDVNVFQDVFAFLEQQYAVKEDGNDVENAGKAQGQKLRGDYGHIDNAVQGLNDIISLLESR